MENKSNKELKAICDKLGISYKGNASSKLLMELISNHSGDVVDDKPDGDKESVEDVKKQTKPHKVKDSKRKIYYKSKQIWIPLCDENDPNAKKLMGMQGTNDFKVE